ncbi:hypothetical protein HH310_17495 [Actinoplanes sp. TBRC 11911]|uniref:hypothetical protein n=1 Tax=Actinoplanes sp. TBRC 11911 TaxID=2729386 RepID=UPI00145C906F|nr:hypothetical protein [Actinoplanes sp. TBRC 11911]NMO52980.1 hypothetical protein [Actinoplanes sp. TBRC 11911]
MPTELHIGIDREKIIVTPYAVRPRTGRIRRHRSGSLIEALPIPPSGRSREDRVTFAARLALPLIFASAVLYAAGVPWWLSAMASAVTVGTVWRRQARAAQFGVLEAPADARVLTRERATFERALVTARRIRRTWPALSGMIDPVTAGDALTGALDDLATVLARRQEILRLRDGLAGVREDGVPAGSPAKLALDDQRDRVELLWRESAEQAERIMDAIEATARAGEAFLRERHLGDTVRRAELMLTSLSAGAPPAGSGSELAEQTNAVISAYRDLTALPASAPPAADQS